MNDVEQTGSATVLSVAGRTVSLYDEGRGIVQAKLSSRAMRVIPGDLVRLRAESELLVSSIEDRRNCLLRTFSYQDREIAANLDHLFVITAVERLFNTTAIDRLLSIASAQQIPATLVLNKIDLGAEPRIDIYRQQGFEVFETSAKFGRGMPELQALLSGNMRVVVLCGVSGVGKSTILNWLLPEAERRTAEVSVKTGQGRQTTTQGIAYPYARPGMAPLFIVDLPGVQHFGISHLTRTQIVASFPEFQRWGIECEYSDCMHVAEPNCAVKAALEDGRVARSRYESYQNMLQELAQMPDSIKYGKARRK